METVSKEQRDAAVSSFGGESACWSILVTGPEDNVQAWAAEVWPEVFDGRKQTCRVRLWFAPDDRDPSLDRAVDAARKHDVTLQLLCAYEPIEATAEHHDLGGGASAVVRELREEYPVLHLGSHEMKWGN